MRHVRSCGLLLLMTMAVLPGCNEAKLEETPMAMTPQISAPEWQALENKRVVFGHQSVGHNILNGLAQLAARDGVKLAIQEQRSTSASKGVSHFLIGKNGDPLSKIQDFAAAIDAGAGQGADIALMKLCYTDINDTTDAGRVADDYIASLESLAQRHPETPFAAVTVPLRAVQTGPKAWLKQLMGKQPSGYLDNAKRAQFNDRLRQRYAAEGRLFDLARIEATPPGKHCTATVAGQQVEALCPELTSDGGHLNRQGQEWLAANWINFVGAFNGKQALR